MFYMIIVKNLCDFHDLYTSPSATFVANFSGRNKDILFLYFNNANWQKANQLLTYKCDQGVALGTTENKSS